VTELAFATSGTTGTPVTWLRTPAQVDAEARVLHATVVGVVDRVVSYAPPQHLYGRAAGVELARVLDVPLTRAWADPLSLADLVPGERCLVVCLPSTWHLLLRAPTALRGCRVTALHSTARTTEVVYEVVDRFGGEDFRAADVLGSTETGAVAYRTIDPDTRDAAEYQLMPDVDLVTEGVEEQRLRISSPRIGRRDDMAVRPDMWTLPDIVVPTGDRRFRHLGRAGRLVKVNGRRCDLDQVEKLVRDLVAGDEADGEIEIACVPVPDAIRGEHYELHYTGPDDRIDPAGLRARLASMRGDLPAPRVIRKVAQLPDAPAIVPT
jgi:acyl-coenzyme A synthetase/AMP-(fatty) acid ligase